MARNAVTSDATGRVLKWGDVDFVAGGEVGAGQSQVAVGDDAFPDLSVEPLEHYKVVGAAFVVMTAPEQAAADAELAAEDQASVKGAGSLNRSVAALVNLPLPPPRMGLLVAVQDGGAGIPALAISGTNRWYIFDRDREHGP